MECVFYIGILYIASKGRIGFSRHIRSTLHQSQHIENELNEEKEHVSDPILNSDDITSQIDLQRDEIISASVLLPVSQIESTVRSSSSYQKIQICLFIF